MTMESSNHSSKSIPFWRDVRVLRVVAQVAFAIFVLLIGLTLCNNLTRGMAKYTTFSFDFLTATASLPLAETTIPYDAHDPMYRAFIVGFLNTLRVVIVGIVFASILGLIGGVARLSSNWLIAKITAVYVEIFVDTPLLIQLYFWYIAGALRLPRVRDSITFPGNFYLSNRGLTMTWYDPNANFGPWLLFIIAALFAAVVVFVLLGRLKPGTLAHNWRGIWAFVTLAAISTLGAEMLKPISMSVPELKGFNFDGGITLSPEYVSITLGLVLYTGAFITEIVRAGIQSVPKGLNEASRALGLTYVQTLRLVTVPVALRVIIPPLTNQYLNLAKNSSLATAVAYPDLFFVGGGIYNMTGQTIQVITLIMATYLLMSLAIAMIMNLVNARFKLVER
jgi:general L-amino acid transport system permease protein